MPALSLALWVVSCRAPPAVEPGGAPTEAAEHATEATAADPDTADTPILVLLVGRGRGHTADASAIAAHLHGLDVALHTRTGAPEQESAIERYRVASRVAAEEHARAVLWVERDPTQGYTLHAVRPKERAIYVRRVERDPTAPSAGLEALGIVTRSIAGALVSDAPLEMDVIEVPPEPVAEPGPAAAAVTSPRTPAPDPAPRVRGRALLSVGYIGTSYARQIPWQSGMEVKAAWGWPFGLHVGAGYAAMQRARARSPIGSLDVRRHPTEVFAGWHRRTRNLWLGAELAFLVDPAVRRAHADGPETLARPDRTVVSTALAPRGRIGVIVVWRVEIFAAVAVEAWLSNVRHAVATASGDVREVLSPRRIRATTSAGVAVRLLPRENPGWIDPSRTQEPRTDRGRGRATDRGRHGPRSRCSAHAARRTG